jgi:hypothetical protein
MARGNGRWTLDNINGNGRSLSWRTRESPTVPQLMYVGIHFGAHGRGPEQ